MITAQKEDCTNKFKLIIIIIIIIYKNIQSSPKNNESHILCEQFKSRKGTVEL